MSVYLTSILQSAIFLFSLGDDLASFLTSNDLIIEELDNHLKGDLVLSHLDKLFQVIIKCAVFELLYKPKTSKNIIIKEYLTASNSFLEDSQTKYLNALLDKIAKKLEKVNIKTKIIGVNRYRLFGIIKVVKEIIQNECDNDIYLNVASGSKIHAVGCMMACMIFDDRTNIHPYYAQAKEYPQYKGNEQQTFGVEEIHKLPTYQIRTPSPKLLSALSLVKSKGRVTKKEFAEEATDLNLINVGAKDENYDQARFASLDKNIIQPLENEWGFIQVEKIGRNRWIKLTKEGEHASEFLP